ncbi:MAG: OFA family MFS transporter [Candidatus Bipolaricaulis sp.]|nr:OFA family MFS transporter [Candidatus Bipolaricaulis sp.]
MSEVKVFGMKAETGRWIFVLVGLLMNVCLGAVYAFSVFRKPLEGLWSVSATQAGLPFMVFLAMFAVFMALAGGLVTSWGPRKTSLLGAVLVGAGWILAGFAPNILWLTIFYGVIGGSGVGILYGCPIAVAAKWFPDKKGFAVGLTLAGFGLSALLMAPWMTSTIASESVGVAKTFMYFGVAFLAVLVTLSFGLRNPKPDWKPAGWKGAAAKGGSGVELDRGQMLRTPAFYALWGSYIIGCLAGLMAIGIAAPVGREVALLSSETAAIAVSLFAVFNGVGRPLFGWLTDKITPRGTALLSFALILGASALLYFAGQGSPAVYFVAFSVLWLNLGGWLAIAPTATSTFFGAKHYAKNYGVVFTAYGIGAIAGNLLSGMIHDATGGYLPVFVPVMGLATLGLVVALVGLRPTSLGAPAGPGAKK